VIVTADPDIIKGCDGSFALLGSQSNSARGLLLRLCTRDLSGILEMSGLDPGEKGEIQRLLCTSSGSPEKFKKFFSQLTPRQRSALTRAFEFFGYEINGYGC